mmetsp:Transcript_24165/g.49522  ORF Transcript_24165/g.49522 Transcript_24165/m.49522 type:complete len:204 (+) Transcript_24165:167-778(+)
MGVKGPLIASFDRHNPLYERALAPRNALCLVFSRLLSLLYQTTQQRIRTNAWLIDWVDGFLSPYGTKSWFSMGVIIRQYGPLHRFRPMPTPIIHHSQFFRSFLLSFLRSFHSRNAPMALQHVHSSIHPSIHHVLRLPAKILSPNPPSRPKHVPRPPHEILPHSTGHHVPGIHGGVLRRSHEARHLFEHFGLHVLFPKRQRDER